MNCIPNRSEIPRARALAMRGFTLIEIMVVVVILAVLGALVVPNILDKVDQARVTRAQADIRAAGLPTRLADRLSLGL